MDKLGGMSVCLSVCLSVVHSLCNGAIWSVRDHRQTDRLLPWAAVAHLLTYRCSVLGELVRGFPAFAQPAGAVSGWGRSDAPGCLRARDVPG